MIHAPIIYENSKNVQRILFTRREIALSSEVQYFSEQQLSSPQRLKIELFFWKLVSEFVKSVLDFTWRYQENSY